MTPYSKPNKISVEILASLFFIIFLSSCNETPKEQKKKPISNKVELKESFKEKIAKHNAEEYKLLDNTCLYCHTIKESKEKVIAPKMQVVVNVYKQAYPSKQAFIDAFVDFTIAPTKEKVIMKGDLATYGLMEDAGHTKDDVAEIAAYLYEYKF
jgi:cytochrome c2